MASSGPGTWKDNMAPSRRLRAEIDGSIFELETAIQAQTAVTIVERKGFGHPDTLADHLAERISREYSLYTRETYGAVLHHNFDKLALLGGTSEVRYGSGCMLAPVRALVNGRAARVCGDSAIPVDDIAVDVVRSFFMDRLPELGDDLKIELNISTNPSPGSVKTDDDKPSDRAMWFAPRSLDDLRERRVLLANDTSLGTGWAPTRSAEELFRDLADLFSAPSPFTATRPWCGSDVKLMGYATAEEIDVVLCVPQKCSHVGGRAQYLENCEEIVAECYRQAEQRLPGMPARFRLNVRDIPERDELYLTYTGSSIESGDEGLVGRGNRVNGLITPTRPMNIEGANGKNPVYHVGKLYNIAAGRIAGRLAEATGGYAEVHLVSATGQQLSRPWRVAIRLAVPDVEPGDIYTIALEVLDAFPAITDEILAGRLLLS